MIQSCSLQEVYKLSLADVSQPNVYQTCAITQPALRVYTLIGIQVRKLHHEMRVLYIASVYVKPVEYNEKKIYRIDII